MVPPSVLARAIRRNFALTTINPILVHLSVCPAQSLDSFLSFFAPLVDLSQRCWHCYATSSRQRGFYDVQAPTWRKAPRLLAPRPFSLLQSAATLINSLGIAFG